MVSSPYQGNIHIVMNQKWIFMNKHYGVLGGEGNLTPIFHPTPPEAHYEGHNMFCTYTESEHSQSKVGVALGLKY